MVDTRAAQRESTRVALWVELMAASMVRTRAESWDPNWAESREARLDDSRVGPMVSPRVALTAASMVSYSVGD